MAPRRWALVVLLCFLAVESPLGAVAHAQAHGCASLPMVLLASSALIQHGSARAVIEEEGLSEDAADVISAMPANDGMSYSVHRKVPQPIPDSVAAPVPPLEVVNPGVDLAFAAAAPAAPEKVDESKFSKPAIAAKRVDTVLKSVDSILGKRWAGFKEHMASKMPGYVPPPAPPKRTVSDESTLLQSSKKAPNPLVSAFDSAFMAGVDRLRLGMERSAARYDASMVEADADFAHEAQRNRVDQVTGSKGGAPARGSAAPEFTAAAEMSKAMTDSLAHFDAAAGLPGGTKKLGAMTGVQAGASARAGTRARARTSMRARTRDPGSSGSSSASSLSADNKAADRLVPVMVVVLMVMLLSRGGDQPFCRYHPPAAPAAADEVKSEEGDASKAEEAAAPPGGAQGGSMGSSASLGSSTQSSDSSKSSDSSGSSTSSGDSTKSFLQNPISESSSGSSASLDSGKSSGESSAISGVQNGGMSAGLMPLLVMGLIVFLFAALIEEAKKAHNTHSHSTLLQQEVATANPTAPQFPKVDVNMLQLEEDTLPVSAPPPPAIAPALTPTTTPTTTTAPTRPFNFANAVDTFILGGLARMARTAEQPSLYRAANRGRMEYYDNMDMANAQTYVGTKDADDTNPMTIMMMVIAVLLLAMISYGYEPPWCKQNSIADGGAGGDQQVSNGEHEFAFGAWVVPMLMMIMVVILADNIMHDLLPPTD